MFPSIVESIVLRLRGLHQRLFGQRILNTIAQRTRAKTNGDKSSAEPTFRRLRASLGFLGKPGYVKNMGIVHSSGRLLLPNNFNILATMASKSVQWSRSLSFIEEILLRKNTSILLPSIIRTLRAQAEPDVMRGEKSIHVKSSAFVISGLAFGEFNAITPWECVSHLEKIQRTVNERLDSMKTFCQRLRREGVPASMTYVDGKMAVKTPNESIMQDKVLPLAEQFLPWSDGWDVLTESPSESNLTSISQRLPSEIAIASDSGRLVDDWNDGSVYHSIVDSSSSQFSNISSVRDILPDATPDEVEVFTAWSSA